MKDLKTVQTELKKTIYERNKISIERDKIVEKIFENYKKIILIIKAQGGSEKEVSEIKNKILELRKKYPCALRYIEKV